MKKKKHRERGFTLSEVIITLVVLGIVAAITVPMMSNSAHDKKWNVGRQKAQATIGEAFRLMTVNGEITDKLSTAEFAQKVIPKYLKLDKLCGNASDTNAAEKCGWKKTGNNIVVKRPDGVSVNLPINFSGLTYSWGVYGSPNAQGVYTQKSCGQQELFAGENNAKYNVNYYFRTLDGFSVSFSYNPFCATGSGDKIFAGAGQFVLDTFCFNAIYDMNGKKGPNQVGKDIGFVGSMYNGFETKAAAMLPHDKVIQVSSLGRGSNVISAIKYCNNLNEKGDWILPDKTEAAMIYLNRTLVTTLSSSHIWTRTILPSGSYNAIMMAITNSSVPSIIGGGATTELGGYFICVRANALR